MEEIGIDIGELARRTELTRVTVSRHLHGHSFPHYLNRKQYARAFGMAMDDFERRWRTESASTEGSERRGNSESYEVLSSSATMPAAFDLPVAASGWVELSGEGATDNLWLARGGAFVVRIRGDSMIDARGVGWSDGQAVQFQKLNPDEDAPVVGADYLFVRNDHHATFKHFWKIDGDQFVLRARNPKYPKPLTVSRDELVTVALARWPIGEPPPPPQFQK